MNVEWFGDQFLDQLKQHVRPQAEEAGRVLTDAIWAKIGTPYPPASAPYSPPHARTQDLRDSYDYVVVEEGENLVLIVGSTLFYSLILELGGQTNWGHIEPRPHIVPAFVEQMDTMAAAILGV